MSSVSTHPGILRRVAELVPEDARRTMWGFAFRLFVAAGVVTILCALAVILRNYVASFDCYQVNARQLVPKHLPAWAGPGVRKDLARLPGLAARFSIMEPGVCDTVADAFRRNPWVDEVVSVSKVYPNHIAVSLKLRRPVAGVLIGNSYYMIDASGHRLTRLLKDWPAGCQALPVIVSGAIVVPKIGEVWPDEGVRSGAVIAKTLLNSRDRMCTRFAVIDVTNLGGRRDVHESDIVLRTPEGTPVKWGRSPLWTISPGELTPDEKVAKMIQFEKKRGPMGAYKFVDIRFDDVQYGPRRENLLSGRDVAE
jgi:hypothetical protein